MKRSPEILEFQGRLAAMGISEKDIRRLELGFVMGEYQGYEPAEKRWRALVTRAGMVELFGAGTVAKLVSECGWVNFDRYPANLVEMTLGEIGSRKWPRKYLWASSMMDYNRALTSNGKLMVRLKRDLGDQGIALEIREFGSGRELREYVESTSGIEGILIDAHGSVDGGGRISG